jgi:hypothetical protein
MVVVEFRTFPFDFAVRIGHEDETRAGRGVDEDLFSGVTEEPGGIGAVVAGKLSELIKDLRFFLFGASFLVTPGVSEGDLFPGHEIPLLFRHGDLLPEDVSGRRLGYVE